MPKFAGEWLIEQIQNFGDYYKNTQIVIVSAAPNIKAIAERYGVWYLPKRLRVILMLRFIGSLWNSLLTYIALNLTRSLKSQSVCHKLGICMMIIKEF